MVKLRYTLVALASLAMVHACNATDHDVRVDKLIQPGMEPVGSSGSFEPPSGRNGLKPSEFWSIEAQSAYRDMHRERLEGELRDINGIQTSILHAPAGSAVHQLLITYPLAAVDLIECALAPDQMVHDDVTNKDIFGWFGLAPSWLHEPLAGHGDQQEWLTACMLARLNYAGQSVDILLEGDTPAIQKHDKFDQVFPYNESTVFGNMFTSTAPLTGRDPAFFAYICRENDLAWTCLRDGGSSYINNRICDDVPFLCGLIDVGLCDPTAFGSLASCKSGTTSDYWKCMKDPNATDYDFRTVGVQLEYPLDPNLCP